MRKHYVQSSQSFLRRIKCIGNVSATSKNDGTFILCMFKLLHVINVTHVACIIIKNCKTGKNISVDKIH